MCPKITAKITFAALINLGKCYFTNILLFAHYIISTYLFTIKKIYSVKNVYVEMNIAANSAIKV